MNPTPAPVTSEPTKDPTLSPVTSAPTPCESRIIFIVTVNEETICSNGNYESVDSKDFFDNFDDCCDMLVAGDKVDTVDKCKREDICNPTEAPTLAPVTSEPTENPTPPPFETIATEAPTQAPVTPEPTENPTPAPLETIATPSPVTAEPTPEPTTPAPTPCEGRKFYSEEKDGVFGCTNEVADFTMDDFTGDMFDTSEECCDALVDSGDLGADEKCGVVDLCNPSEAPTVSPTNVVTTGSTPTVGTESESGLTMPPR